MKQCKCSHASVGIAGFAYADRSYFWVVTQLKLPSCLSTTLQAHGGHFHWNYSFIVFLSAAVEVCSAGIGLFNADWQRDGRTDMAKLTVTFRNCFVNTPHLRITVLHACPLYNILNTWPKQYDRGVNVWGG